jgi:hypothetical protein
MLLHPGRQALATLAADATGAAALALGGAAADFLGDPFTLWQPLAP